MLGAQRRERPLDLADDVIVREVERALSGVDAALGLQHDLVALGGAQPQRLGEAALTEVHASAVDVGVVEEVDACAAGRVVEFADLRVILVIDAHHSGDDGGGSGGSERDGLHTPTLVRTRGELCDCDAERLRDLGQIGDGEVDLARELPPQLGAGDAHARREPLAAAPSPQQFLFHRVSHHTSHICRHS